MSSPAPRLGTLKVSEIFESLQGEGVTAGEPAVFLRLATCNLHCVWCDTKYTWDFNQYRYEDEVRSREVGDVARELGRSAARRLVITGGEPLLQQRALEALTVELGSGWTLEVETNGTLAPSRNLGERVDQWNVSPKLSNSENRESLRVRPAALARLLETGRAWLKLVVANEADVAEAGELVSRLGWPAERVLLMPEAGTRELCEARMPFVLAASGVRGWRSSGRLHLELWGGRRGR